MNVNENGGSAFPYPVCTADGYPGQYAEPGMSLRDWFAGMALQALGSKGYDWEGLATDAYRIADAMLKARET